MKKQDAIDHFAAGLGDAAGIRAIAEALKISREAIYQWPERVPELRAYQLERASGGALAAEEAPQ